MVDGWFLPGSLCFGIPVENPGYVLQELSVKVQEVVKQIVIVIEGEGQAFWTIARSITAKKLDYHLSL
jgi:hypothetical protein